MGVLRRVGRRFLRHVRRRALRQGEQDHRRAQRVRASRTGDLRGCRLRPELDAQKAPEALDGGGLPQRCPRVGSPAPQADGAVRCHSVRASRRRANAHRSQRGSGHRPSVRRQHCAAPRLQASRRPETYSECAKRRQDAAQQQSGPSAEPGWGRVECSEFAMAPSGHRRPAVAARRAGGWRGGRGRRGAVRSGDPDHGCRARLRSGRKPLPRPRQAERPGGPLRSLRGAQQELEPALLSLRAAEGRVSLNPHGARHRQLQVDGDE